MPRHLELMRLDDVLPAERNPKDHDEQTIKASIGRWGLIEIPTLDERTGRLVAGHGRTDELRDRAAKGEPPPDGVEVDDDGAWRVPVLRGWRSIDDEDALAAGIALNRAGERGGWIVDELQSILDSFGSDDQWIGTGFDAADLDDLIAASQEATLEFREAVGYGGGGAHADPGLDERLQKYAGKGVRMLVLDYTLADFDEIAATLARLRRDRNVGTNAEMVIALVREAAASL